MVIKFSTMTGVIVGFLILLSLNCKKRNETCPKMGYEYVTSSSKCWYSPTNDSIPLNSIIYIEAALPKIFADENSNVTVSNTDGKVEGPLQIIMLSPLKDGAIENFEITPKVGSVFKDSLHASNSQLKSFRTIIWDNQRDSFVMKLELKPINKGVYGISIGQQSNRDKDCALYKYFLKIGNADQHLNYLALYNNGYISDYERNYAYCFKVY